MCSDDITMILDTTNLRVFNSCGVGRQKEEPLIEPCTVPIRKIREGRKEELMEVQTKPKIHDNFFVVCWSKGGLNINDLPCSIVRP
jgi:hypothetical protein